MSSWIWNRLLQDTLCSAWSSEPCSDSDASTVWLSYRRHPFPARATRGYKRAQDARAAYTRLERKFINELMEEWTHYESGAMSLDEFEQWFAQRQREVMVDAFAIGLVARGVKGKTRFTDDELRYLHGQYSLQMRYFRRFMRDVRANRGTMPYRERLRLYGRDLYGVFMTAWFAYGAHHDHRFLWRLTKDAEHCNDCLHRAMESHAKGGYTYKELIRLGLPGTGRTQCLNNCRCWIEERVMGHRTTPRKLERKR